MNPQNSQNLSLSEYLSLMTANTVEGAKDGAAANVARKITAAVSTQLGLPEWTRVGMLKHLLPIAVCFGVGALFTVLPNIPKASVISRIALRAARGAAASAVEQVEIFDMLQSLGATILGMADMGGMNMEEVEGESGKKDGKE